MTANDNKTEAQGAQNDASLTHLFEIVQQAMRLAGWDPKYRVALVMEYDGRPEATTFVSNIASAERVREIVDTYVERERAGQVVASDLMKKLRENNG